LQQVIRKKRKGALGERKEQSCGSAIWGGSDKGQSRGTPSEDGVTKNYAAKKTSGQKNTCRKKKKVLGKKPLKWPEPEGTTRTEIA